MISKKAKLIFLMPPKTASNSIKECLLDSSIDFEDFDSSFKSPKIHLYLSELVEVFEIDDLDKYKIIQVVRNPTTRFVSSYFHQLNIIPKNAQNIKISGMSFVEFTEHFHKSLLSEGHFIDNFYGNSRFIKNAIRNGKSWGGSRTYLNQLQWNDLKDIDVHYIKLEELTEDITILSKEIGVYLPELEKKNTNKLEVDYNKVLTKETQAIIDEVYYSDFLKLKY